MVSEYIPRVVDSLVESRLKRPMAVVIKGPKYCGKTRTAEMCCRSALYLADHETKSYVEVAAQTGSRSYLDGEYPLDEAARIIKRDTRHFAKRQITWFKREKNVVWADRSVIGQDDEKLADYMLDCLRDRKII